MARRTRATAARTPGLARRRTHALAPARRFRRAEQTRRSPPVPGADGRAVRSFRRETQTDRRTTRVGRAKDARQAPAVPEPAAARRNHASTAAAPNSPQARRDRRTRPRQATAADWRIRRASELQTDPAPRRHPGRDSRGRDSPAAPDDAEAERTAAADAGRLEAVAIPSIQAPHAADAARGRSEADAAAPHRPAGPARAGPGHVAKDCCTVSSLGTPVAHPRTPDPVAASIPRRRLDIPGGVPPREPGYGTAVFAPAQRGASAAGFSPRLVAHGTECAKIEPPNQDSSASPLVLRHRARQGLRITRAATTQRARTGPRLKRDHPAG